MEKNSTISENTLLFSVIVPVYNNGKDLEKCVHSILRQSYEDFELILVDDGSTDQSPDICDWFASKDERVQVIHKQHEGVVTARNVGLFRANGLYIYYVDGDDWISTKLLEKASRILNQENPPDIFMFCYMTIKQNGKFEKTNLSINRGMYDKKRLEEVVYPRLICKFGKKRGRGVDSGSLWDKVISKELLEKHYCREDSLFRHEDSVCSYECMYFADKIYFSEDVMYFYNQLSMSSGQKIYHTDLLANNRLVAQYLRVHLGQRGNNFIDRQINMVEFDGLVRVIHQEIQFNHPICKSAFLLGKKFNYEQYPSLSSYEGFSFLGRVYIFLLKHRCFFLLLLYTKLKVHYLDKNY